MYARVVKSSDESRSSAAGAAAGEGLLHNVASEPRAECAALLPARTGSPWLPASVAMSLRNMPGCHHHSRLGQEGAPYRSSLMS
ncbi:MAG: hypothetical protein ACPIOQ_77245, partial [Promethearchaeia archaeon]